MQWRRVRENRMSPPCSMHREIWTTLDSHREGFLVSKIVISRSYPLNLAVLS
jgi:hypothetical protein